jgi:hypothetical protein
MIRIRSGGVTILVAALCALGCIARCLATEDDDFALARERAEKQGQEMINLLDNVKEVG